MPERSFLPALDVDRPGSSWMRSPYGAFALAFPGVIAGYSLVPDVAWSEVLTVIGAIAIGGAVSWTCLAALFAALRISGIDAMVWTAAIAIGTYYWFAAESSVGAFQGPDWLAWLLRAALLAVIATWLVHTRRGAQGRDVSSPPVPITVRPRDTPRPS